jgi:hypothetical protein
VSVGEERAEGEGFCTIVKFLFFLVRKTRTKAISGMRKPDGEGKFVRKVNS